MGDDNSEREVARVKVFELADELAVRSVDVLDAAQQAQVPVRDAGTELTDAQADQVRAAHRDRVAAQAREAELAAAPVPPAPPAPPPTPVMAPAGATTMPPGSAPAWNPAPGMAPPPGYGPGQPGHPGEPGQPLMPGALPPGAGSSGPMHPLIRKAIWELVLAHVIPCIGLYFFVASYLHAGQGRRQVAMYHGKWGGDTAGLVIQIVFWIEVVLITVWMLFVFTHLSSFAPPPTTGG